MEDNMEQQPKEPSSPKQQKRSNTATVTPEGKRQRPIPRKDNARKEKSKQKKQQVSTWYGNKILDPSECMRIDKPFNAINGLREPPVHVYFMDIAYGLITLFYVDFFLGGIEGNVWSILKAYQCLQKSEKTKLDSYDIQFVKMTQFIGIFPRRISKFVDEPILKTGKVDPTKSYPMVAMAACFPQGAKGSDQKFDVLHQISRFLNFRGINANVPASYNRTNRQIQSADNYLQDLQIMHIMKCFFKGRVDTTFYDRYQQHREAFFSRPYPEFAKSHLGYPDEPQGSGNSTENAITITGTSAQTTTEDNEATKGNNAPTPTEEPEQVDITNTPEQS